MLQKAIPNRMAFLIFIVNTTVVSDFLKPLKRQGYHFLTPGIGIKCL
jgi:hypothetical protein